jgi:hypothetical protein
VNTSALLGSDMPPLFAEQWSPIPSLDLERIVGLAERQETRFNEAARALGKLFGERPDNAFDGVASASSTVADVDERRVP